MSIPVKMLMERYGEQKRGGEGSWTRISVVLGRNDSRLVFQVTVSMVYNGDEKED